MRSESGIDVCLTLTANTCMCPDVSDFVTSAPCRYGSCLLLSNRDFAGGHAMNVELFQFRQPAA